MIYRARQSTAQIALAATWRLLARTVIAAPGPVRVRDQLAGAAIEAAEADCRRRHSAFIFRISSSENPNLPRSACLSVIEVHGMLMMPVFEWLLPPSNRWPASWAIMFPSNTPRRIRRLELYRIDGSAYAWLAVSPDGRSILYDQFEPTASDIMLVENFR